MRAKAELELLGDALGIEVAVIDSELPMEPRLPVIHIYGGYSSGVWCVIIITINRNCVQQMAGWIDVARTSTILSPDFWPG